MGVHHRRVPVRRHLSGAHRSPDPRGPLGQLCGDGGNSVAAYPPGMGGNP